MNAGNSQGDSVHLVILIFAYGLPFLLLFCGGLIGTILERRHFASIRRREAATGDLPTVPTRSLDPDRKVAETRLVSASVVVSHDYLKRFLAQLRKIFGGRLRSYESLLDRARREAILRLKEQVPEASIIVNLRLETATIGRTHGKQGLGAVEVLAYGTAVRYT
ncbi:MAG: YbjQ family protein [Verrucomicrobia bacterium]|nr:MAG: YbjQ family protein [Verrucomicrobiota bacterium]